MPSGTSRAERRAKGGRKAGGKNTRTKLLAEALAKTGITPLEYMLKQMRDSKNSAERRDDMAKAAAPYIHPKLTAISAPNGGPVELSLRVNFVAATQNN